MLITWIFGIAELFVKRFFPGIKMILPLKIYAIFVPTSVLKKLFGVSVFM